MSVLYVRNPSTGQLEPLEVGGSGGSGGGVLCVTATITGNETVDGSQILTGTADKTYEEILSACNAGQSVLLHVATGTAYAIIPLVVYNRHELLFSLYVPKGDTAVAAAITSDNIFHMEFFTMESRINSLIDEKLGVIENGTY